MKKKKVEKTKASDYLPIPSPADQGESMLDRVMGYSYPEGAKYPVDAKMQKTGNYAPYTTGTKMREEERRIQDELLSEQLKYLERNPGSVGDPQVEAVMGSFQSDPSYPEPSKYGSDPFYPKRPMHQAPKTYYDAPFERTPLNLDKEPGYVPERSPYKIAPGVATPLGTTPNESAAIEEAIQKALSGAARAGAAKGNSVKFRK